MMAVVGLMMAMTLMMMLMMDDGDAQHNGREK